MTDTTTVQILDDEDETTVEISEVEATVVTLSDTKTVVIAAAEIGPRGPQGPSGSSVGTYEHIQNTPLEVWTVQHNLGVRPGGITVLGDDGQLIFGWTVTHASLNVLVLSFPQPEPGVAYIS